MKQKKSIRKQMWDAWVGMCRGEFIVFILGLFVLGIFIIFIYKFNLWNYWLGYIIIFTIIWTRFLSLWIDKKKNKLNQSS